MFLKPIYYKIVTDTTGASEIKRFEKNTPWWLITGKENYFYGLKEMQVIPGGFVKTGFAFEFSKNDKKIKMLEIGVSLEVYPKPIVILETQNNQIIFPTLYLSYRFGKVESGYYLKKQDEGILK